MEVCAHSGSLAGSTIQLEKLELQTFSPEYSDYR